MTASEKPRALIFDWDNTLVDSWPVIHDALNTTYRAFGLREWTLDETRANVRESVRDRFPKIFGDEWEAASDVFYKRYANIHADAIKPTEGADDMLKQLADAGFYLSIVSNKRGDYLRKEAKALGWHRHFSALIGAFDADRDKPDPAPVHMALEQGDFNPGPKVWFVGDADIDLTCAVNTGCIPVLLRPEAPGDGEFGAHPPVHHFGNCQSLCNFLQSM
ncbi:MAG: HAD-IA family hydrolase [Rhodospirillales bacterium]|nr:HAD-IA family hydrolase [Rhodospirillales bacterium]MBO6786836.1 HAD-IA family hydrolase [Rhodospirillales bacterium]